MVEKVAYWIGVRQTRGMEPRDEERAEWAEEQSRLLTTLMGLRENPTEEEKMSSINAVTEQLRETLGMNEVAMLQREIISDAVNRRRKQD